MSKRHPSFVHVLNFFTYEHLPAHLKATQKADAHSKQRKTEMSKFGIHHDEEHAAEIRKMLKPFKSAGAYSAPPAVDPRTVMKTESQGAQGSCGGQAGSSVREWINFLATGEMVQFSAQYTYVEAQRNAGMQLQDSGCHPGSVAEILKRVVCREEKAPYTGSYFTDFSADAKADAEAHAMPGAELVELKNYNELFEFIASGQGGVLQAMMWGGEYQDPPGGIVESFGGAFVGGHLTCVLGYDKDKKDREFNPYLWCLNSHSDRYGDKGWFLQSPHAVNQACEHAATVYIGVTDMAEPKVRTIPLIASEW